MSLSDPRPIHARQIAAMALKRKLAQGDPEELYRAIRAALLDDARARQGRGLRPRVRHQGGSLFAIATARIEPELARAEDALAERAAALHVATRDALVRRLEKLPLAALAELGRVYLERLGYHDVAHVKRVEQTAYLTARGRRGGLATTVLCGVRAGSDELGRRSIGELRAGVLAKKLDEGILLACGLLSADGDREAREPGPPITILDAIAYAEELLRTGAGMVRVSMPIAYLDADFFAELVQA